MYYINFKQLLLYLGFIFGFVYGSCPDGCVCSSKSVICTCNELPWSLPHQPQKTLHLSDLSSNLEYIDLFVVHSCDKLIISNDTFTNIEISEQFKLLDIGLIEIESYAFRGIRKSPIQIVIQNSYFERIPEYAFIGLTNVEHFWFKNVSINRIEKFAFSRLQNFNYLYFRNINVKRIDNEAFSNMHHINYFYMRENISLSHVDDYIFLNSHISEIMFENAHVKATDFTLSGFTANKIEIVSSKWFTTKVTNQKMIFQSVANFEVKNSTFNRMVPSLFYNYTNIIIDFSKIHHFAAASGFICNFESLTLQNSKIIQWHSHAISENSKIGTFSIQNSLMDKVLPRSIYGAQINVFLIDKSTFGSTSKKFIDNSNITKMLISESKFDSFAAETFANTFFNVLILNKNKFLKLQNRAFGGIIATQMQITGCVFSKFPEFMFEKSNISDLTIFSSQFQSAPSKTVFAGVNALKLQFTHSEIVCNIQDCETNSLFFQSTLDHLAWKFQYNRCISSSTLRIINPSAICLNTTKIITEEGLICQRRLEIEECICTNNELALLPKTKSSILTLGDCESILVAETHSTNLHSLYLYRARMIFIESLPETLQQLEILHSTIRFEKPFLIRGFGMEKIKFNGVIIDGITDQAFANNFIGSLTFNHSVLSNVADSAFSNSVINQLNIEASEIISTGNLFAQTKGAKIINSRIKNISNLQNIPNICFQNNTIDCRCSSKMNLKLPQNQCLDDSNHCLTPENNSNEYWRKTRNIEKICSNKNEGDSEPLQLSRSSSNYGLFLNNCLIVFLGAFLIAFFK